MTLNTLVRRLSTLLGITPSRLLLAPGVGLKLLWKTIGKVTSRMFKQLCVE
jgi:hypothetical protein